MQTVAVAPGIGDAVWTCQKIKAFSEYVQDDIRICVSDSPFHKSDDFWKLCPYVKEVELTRAAPVDLPAFMGDYWHPRWNTLQGCRNHRGFDWVLIPLPHLERGLRIEKWLPELNTEFDCPLNIPTIKNDKVLMYLSGTNANTGFHRNWWHGAHHQKVITLLNSKGIKPTLVGANTQSDLDYFKQCNLRGDFENLIGQTNIEQYLTLIKGAKLWFGLNSGGGIYAAMAGTPTLMFWSDKRFQTGGALLIPEQQRNWLSAAQLSTYSTMSLGDQRMTPQAVAGEVLRKLSLSGVPQTVSELPPATPSRPIRQNVVRNVVRTIGRR